MTTSLILHTILALLLLIVPFGALYLLDRPSIRPFGTALVRGIVQLLVFSLIVWGVYKIDNTWINIIWFVAMTIWGGLLVVSKCHLSIKDYLLPASAGLFGGTIAVGLWLLVAVLSSDPIVVTMADHFLPWACMIPLAGTLAFILDGICIGLTLTRPMLLASFVASLLFFAVAWLAFAFTLPSQVWTNHLLWLAFILYLLVRGVVISLLRKSILS